MIFYSTTKTDHMEETKNKNIYSSLIIGLSIIIAAFLLSNALNRYSETQRYETEGMRIIDKVSKRAYYPKIENDL